MGSCGMSCMRRDKRVIVERGNPKILSGESSKRIQADNASINVFLEYARALTKDKKFKEALSVISLCSQMASLSTDVIQEFGAELIDFYSVHIGKGSFHTDPWSCCICGTVLVDAVTLGSCGHSVCKKCVLRDLTSACKKCGTAYEPFNTDPMDEESNIKLSILVCELTNKYWEKEKQAVQLRNEGNKLFQRGDVEASLVKYSEAFQLSKEDHLITSNRSHAYFKCWEARGCFGRRRANNCSETRLGEGILQERDGSLLFGKHGGGAHLVLPVPCTRRELFKSS